MKTKLLFGVLLTFLVSSCIKDFHGHGGHDINFTEKNYVYEGDLYSIYLDDEIEILDIKIQELEDIINNNQGDQNTQTDLEAAKEQRIMLNDELQGVFSLEQVGLRLPPPPPPCPRPRNCDFSGLEYILTDVSVEKIRIIFLDDNGNTIGGGTIDDLSTLPDSAGQINFSKLMINGQQGSVAAIQVQAFNSQGIEERNYLVK
ncbi:hypothetical protein [Maribacter arenosus]|uniref:Uncharacterized protein n=1 Tax=Maribacter arenosus TaxID=1854708 RepID=A0ABR7VJ42_9FLAO|nr:hypothetical protein [Maribacter arenosus]MBD0852552.1 hypothetical protein [Maribacter arenosus]